MYPASYKSHNLTVWTLLSGGALVMAITLTVSASAQPTGTNAPKIKQSEIPYVTPVSGKQMYEAYCAVCHGANADGNSHAATVLVPHPTTLSLLSSRNGGKFPKDRVKYRLMDLGNHPEDRATGMPCWGPALKSLDNTNPDLAILRVRNLMTYLETMQARPVKAGTDQGSSATPR